MAVGTGNVARFVRAALPVVASALVMAAQADRIVVRDGPAGIVLAERDDPADAASAARLDVQRSGAVAGLAAAFLLRGARITEDSPHGGLCKSGGVSRMTTHASL